MYAGLDDLIARAGEAEIRQIADRDRDGTPDPEVITAAIADAAETIDGYLRGRYLTPLSDPPPAMVRGWAVSIARHRLHRNGPPEHVIADYRDALKQLGDASAGRLVLAGVDGVAAPVADAAGGVHAASDAPVFSRPGAMDGWL
ncbi:MAG: hypothetical protein CMO30_24690 [Tistrella sp.]|uniref:DUF1320 domain-containing protein n=1 Tax=Tistrella mobilis TaxID=171437 RepID=A0A3B9IEQ2_9PROT|nr:DUF1320 domain-containing protein [Tistrella sp.]MAD35449.1 hypothetical protein [Tistrella sp.]MBA78478.1 hypothetical protein [Tistrella sp.]HAE45853.1 DUF1320 domain-containing protein [Tistrella mobilis]|tara:strand:+ start:533 stop:964 length:432 start_codon:yes stop_codon:yes gene_type:complete